MSADMAKALETSNQQAGAGYTSAVTQTPESRPKGFVQRASTGGKTSRALGRFEELSSADDTEAGTSLNLVKADLPTVVDTILSQKLGQNYMIEDGLDGTVTLQTNKPLSRSQLLATLQEILAMNGAAMIETNGLYRIVRQSGSSDTRQLSFEEAASRGLSVRVTPLAHASAAAVGRMLENFAPANGRIEIDEERNVVFSIGSAKEQRSIADVISVLDRDFMSDMAFALEPLNEARASTLIEELESISGGDKDGGQGALRYLAIERMNAILVIAKTNAALDQARSWIKRLDQGIGDGQQLFVYPVKNRRAEELARIVGRVFSIQALYDSQPAGAVAPGLTGTTLTTNGDANGLGGGGLGGFQPTPAAQNAAAPPGTSGGQEGVNSDVRVIADNSTNALIVYADYNTYQPIKKALDRLDVLPVQVLIEATLLEVSLSNDLQFGVRWFFQSGDSSFDFTNVANAGTATASSGFNYVLDTTDVRFVLSALRQVTDVEFLSAPNMMVLDNQTARLQVGDEVPVQTRAAASTLVPDAPIVNDIEYRSTGVILSVRPKVTNDGLVVLDVVQEVSDVIETMTSGISSPTIQQRRFESTVAIASGETVILGGLTSRTNSLGRTGIPVLSSIPVIGNAFTSRANTRDRTELLVMITPRVIRDQRAARAATDEMRAKLYDLFDDVPTQGERLLFAHESGT
ncbi:MAG: type II secretion system secretin GspD [Pseudomonadota bacterium]